MRTDPDAQIVLCSATTKALNPEDLARAFGTRLPDVKWCTGDSAFPLPRGDSPSSSVASSSAILSVSNPLSAATAHGVLKVKDRHEALDAVRRILRSDPPPRQTLIFVDDVHRVADLVKGLAALGIAARALCGDTSAGRPTYETQSGGGGGGGGGDEDDDSQPPSPLPPSSSSSSSPQPPSRLHALKLGRSDAAQALRSGSASVVVATELAARGIDAVHLSHVINADLPTDSMHYCHRAGRVGRFGVKTWTTGEGEEGGGQLELATATATATASRKPGVVISIAVGRKEENVLDKLGRQLNLIMNVVDAREGKLFVVDQEGAATRTAPSSE